MSEDVLKAAALQAEKLKENYSRREAYRRWFSPDGLVPFTMEAVKWKDEHDRENPIKSPPDEEYIRYLLEKFRTEETLVVVKSRQVMVSWIAYTTILWEMLRRPHTKIALVPQTEKDGFVHIEDRIYSSLWENLPPWLKSLYKVNHVEGMFSVDWRRGERWSSGVTCYARGENQLRNFTHTIVCWDEMGAQPLAPKTWKAAVPTAGSRGSLRGRLWCISTPIPYSKHHELCDPELVAIAAQVARGELAEVA